MKKNSYSLSEISQWCDGRLIVNGTEESVVSKLAFDGRLIFDTKGVLFFALKSSNNDGHSYISELYARGVRMFVVENSFVIKDGFPLASWIVVKNSLEALQNISEKHRENVDAEIVAITGSNGKTIVKEWLTQFFYNDINIVRSPRSYNSQIGVPLSLWEINREHKIAFIEAGISKPDEMDKLQKVIKPNIGILTNIGNAHKENFSSKKNILDEKIKLFNDVETIFYNSDDLLINDAVKKLNATNKISWGRNSDADLQLISEDKNDISKLIFKWKNNHFEVSIPFNDEVSVENIMPVIAYAIYKGYDFVTIAQRVLKLEPVAMRMEQIDGINGSLIINDSYNSDILSLEVAINFLNQQANKKEIGRTLILSDFIQNGNNDAEVYSQIATLVTQNKISKFIGIGEKLMSFSSKFRDTDLFFHSTDAFIKDFHKFSFRDEAILIKGARSFTFERIVELLEKKQHSTILEVNLDAFINNLNILKSNLKPTTKILGMVKAFAYGSGSYQISSVLQSQNADYLGVAFADEGVELRQNGITLPIIVMNPEVKTFHQMLEFDLEPEIYNLENLFAFDKTVKEFGGEGKIHIKIDTGMNRFGFLKSEIDLLIEELLKRPYLKVASIFSHLVGSDEVEHDEFTHKQAALFSEIAEKISIVFKYPIIKHILNSAGIERFPEYQFDMVRPGIGLYGFSAVNNSNFKNVLTLKSYVSQIKMVEENPFVGYGRKGKLNLGDKIAVIPIGYADGFNRLLSNGVGQVMINNKLYPIVGRVCMDTCMVNITGGNVNLNDEVIIFGDDYPPMKMAELLNTIPYEIITSINQRVKRVYYKE